MTNLNDLPVDVLLQIVCFLPPRDVVLCVRLTCRIFWEASMARSLWLDLLHRVCLENKVFLPTFDKGVMSLCDLEHAATLPARFIFSVRKTESPDSPVPLLMYSKRSLDVMNRILRTVLVPGGRFLFTHSTRIHLWDLGNSGDAVDLSGRLPMASLDLGRPYCDTMIAHPTRDGKGIILLVCADDPRVLGYGRTYVTRFLSGNRDLLVYTIYPASDFPTFRLVGKHTIHRSGREIDQYALGFERVTTLVDRQIRVWDFQADTCTTWAPFDHSPAPFEKLLILDDYILLGKGDTVSFWHTPRLYPCTSPRGLVPQNLVPDYRLKIWKEDNTVPPSMSNFTTLDHWYSQTGQDFLVDHIFMRDEEGTFWCFRHRLEFAPPFSPLLPGFPSSSPEQHTETDFSRHRGVPKSFENILRFEIPGGVGIAEENYLADGHTVVYSCEEQELCVMTAPNECGHNTSVQVRRARYNIPGMSQYLSRLCPVSGRLCIVADEVHATEVQVVDFLAHPDALQGVAQ